MASMSIRVLLASFSLAVGGCAQLPAGGLQEALEALTPAARPETVAIELPPAPRPSVRLGDTYVFGASSVRRVAAVTATGLTWSTTDGDRYRSSRDFFAPLLEQSRPQQRHRSTLSGQPAALWPLSVGKRVSFEETRVTWLGTVDREFTTRLRWDCEVQDARLSSVPAGDFEAFHVVCKAYRPGLFLPLQTVTWDYAPSLGHYVRRTWFEGGRPREAALAAALPAALATPPRIAATLQRLAASAAVP